MSAPDPEPDWTRRCLPHHLDEIGGDPYMLRTTDSDESPWRMVKVRHDGFWTDEATGTQFNYMTVEFHNDDSTRILNLGDEIEVGFIRPPFWPPEFQPPEWPSDYTLPDPH